MSDSTLRLSEARERLAEAETPEDFRTALAELSEVEITEDESDEGEDPGQLARRFGTRHRYSQ